MTCAVHVDEKASHTQTRSILETWLQRIEKGQQLLPLFLNIRTVFKFGLGLLHCFATVDLGVTECCLK